MTGDQELLEVFKAEVAEQIEQLRQMLEPPAGEWDLQSLFRVSHNVKGAARMVDALVVRDVAHALEDLFSFLRDGGAATPEVVHLAREGAGLLENVFLENGVGADAPAAYRGAVDAAITGKAVAAAAAAPAARAGAAEEKAPVTATELAGDATLRVGLEKLDRLMEFAAELVAAGFRMEERVAEAAQAQGAAERLVKTAAADKSGAKQVETALRALRRDLAKDRVQYEQVSSQLREAIRHLRMVRIDSMRTVFNRVVRDAAASEGKSVVLRLEGGDTEIDRSVLEGLRDPLVHLIRNAVAHGIELPEARVAAGKPSGGVVTLQAVTDGGWVNIRVSDDGAGINLAAVRARAIERGLLAEDAAATPQELAECLFQPGFSTAERVTDLAGRGVGLDVVRQNVAKLGGEVEAVQRKGGAAFEMRVPLTRLTTKGILVRIADHFLAVPINAVERTVSIAAADLREVDGTMVYPILNVPLPVVALESVFELESDGQAVRPSVVLRSDEGRVVCLADEVLGEKEFVVQRLSWNVKRLRGVSGSAVLDGGRICIVLDAAGLVTARGRKSGSLEAGAAETAKHRNILVVDDSITTRTLEKNILTSAGFNVTLAVDGEEAWSKLVEGQFDLLISDVEMPRLTGLELAKRVRGDDRLRTLPLILVTSLGNDQQKLAGAEAGANAYIVKGEFDQDALLTAVTRLL